MVRFRVLYLAEEKCEPYRSQSPKKPPYLLTRSNYRDGPEVSAESPYEVWQALRGHPEFPVPSGSKPIAVGDALEAEGRLLVCNYWGFDPAEWRSAPPRSANSKTTCG